MVKIRLKRMGANKKPFYRVVVADSRTARSMKKQLKNGSVRVHSPRKESAASSRRSASSNKKAVVTNERISESHRKSSGYKA